LEMLKFSIFPFLQEQILVKKIEEFF